MTNIATLLETAIAQVLPDNWQQEPETHLPALSLIISNILLPNCCQMSNLNSLATLIEESAVLNSCLLLTKISWRIQFMILWHASTAWAENKTTLFITGGFIFYVYSAVSENRLQLQIQFRCFYPYSDIIIHQLADLNIAGSTQQSVGISKIQFFFQH